MDPPNAFGWLNNFSLKALFNSKTSDRSNTTAPQALRHCKAGLNVEIKMLIPAEAIKSNLTHGVSLLRPAGRCGTMKKLLTGTAVLFLPVPVSERLVFKHSPAARRGGATPAIQYR